MNTTVTEIKNILPAMVIKMAGQAVKEGVRMCREYWQERDLQKQFRDSGKPYNFTLSHAHYGSVRVAAEILFELFATCTADILQAIEKVSKNLNGYAGAQDHYLEEFIIALEEQLCSTVRVRDVA